MTDRLRRSGAFFLAAAMGAVLLTSCGGNAGNSDIPSSQEESSASQTQMDSEGSLSPEPEPEDSSSQEEKQELILYTVDANSMEIEKHPLDSIPSTASFEDCLAVISEGLSGQFQGLELTLTLEDGGLIQANLLDNGSLESGWYQCFQGSTGSIVTETTLSWTILQPEAEEWQAAGVYFLWNGEPLPEMISEHFNEKSPVYRDKLSPPSFPEQVQM